MGRNRQAFRSDLEDGNAGGWHGVGYKIALRCMGGVAQTVCARGAGHSIQLVFAEVPNEWRRVMKLDKTAKCK